MAEYILRESVITEANHNKAVGMAIADIVDIKEILNNIPTADVIEVVRCRDCMYKKNAKANHKGFLICPASGMEITNSDFCSYGKRMDSE